MQNFMSCACLALQLTRFAFAQQPASKEKASDVKQASSASAQANLDQILETKIRAAWGAFKNKDKNAYSDFLTNDFIAVEADNEGTRNKWHVLREVESSMVHDYVLSLFKVTQLGPDAAFVTYEASIQFPPKAQVRFERVYIGEVWVKRDGQWKALHYQETRVK